MHTWFGWEDLTPGGNFIYFFIKLTMWKGIVNIHLMKFPTLGSNNNKKYSNNAFEEDYEYWSEVTWSWSLRPSVDELKIALPITTLCCASSLPGLDQFIHFIFQYE